MPPSPPPTSATVWCARPLPIDPGAAWLSSREKAKASAFRREADRRRFVTGRALVRAVVGERLGAAPASIDVRVGARGGPTPGRPFVVDGPSFSVAHAGRWVLVAVVDGAWRGEGGTASGSAVSGVEDGAATGVSTGAATGVSIGVDVESVGPARDHLGDLLDVVPPQERPARGWTAESFTRSWVRREAVLKAVGTGLLAPRDDLLLARADADPAIVRSGGALPAPDRLALRDLTLRDLARQNDESYLAAVALYAPRPADPPGSARSPAVAFADVALADGHALLARYGLGVL